VLISAAVLVCAFSLEAAGLRAATPANSAAARAATWLLRYRYATSSIDVRGRTIGGRCFHGWFAGSRGRAERGTLLLLSDGGSVRAAEPARPVAARSFTLAPVNALELAGCTKILGARVAGLAQFDARVRLTRAWLAGRRVAAIRFDHLILLVTPKTDRPVGVLLHGMKSRIRLERVTPAIAARLEAA
jgi:hypothetical protein